MWSQALDLPQQWSGGFGVREQRKHVYREGRGGGGHELEQETSLGVTLPMRGGATAVADVAEEMVEEVGFAAAVIPAAVMASVAPAVTAPAVTARRCDSSCGDVEAAAVCRCLSVCCGRT